MIYDTLAGIYQHHLDMFEIHKKQKPKDWDIVQTASFVLDIADEEFRQEEKYDRKEFIKVGSPQMREAEITINDLKPSSLDRFTQKRLEKELEETLGKQEETDSGITLRTDFKENFLKWMNDNLEDLQEEGLSGDLEEIFNDLCVSAKAGQALRLSRQ